MTKTEQIVAFVRSHVGKPYRLGGRGPDEWDCSGLTKMAVKQIGFDWYHGASTQWKRGSQEGRADQYGYWADSGEITTRPSGRLLFLFNQDKANPGIMAHTGLYDPVSGNVIQAGGYGGRGVHENPPRWDRWTHWSTLRGAEEEIEMSTDLKRGSVGDQVRLLQEALMARGYDVGKNTKADGIFGPATEAGVKAFQADHGIPVSGVWADADWGLLDAIPPDAPPVEPDPSVPIDRMALLAELEGISKRLTIIIGALREVG